MRILLNGMSMFAAAASLAVSAPAHADSVWWAIYGWGEKPNRAMIVIDASDITNWDESVTSSAYIVYESPNDPDYKHYLHKFTCKTGEFQEAHISTFTRHTNDSFSAKGDAAKVNQQPVQTIKPGSWQERAMEFACNPSSRSGDNGMSIIGYGSSAYQPVDSVWKLWGEDHRPPYTWDKISDEEFAAKKAELLAKIDKTREDNRNWAADFRKGEETKSAEREDEQKRFLERQAIIRKAGDSTQLGYRAMETWLDTDEQELLTRWGVPNRSQQSGDLTFHTYTWGHSSTGVNGFGAVVSQATYRCDATFILRANKVIDVRVGGNSCGKIRPK